jgi:uncharacterized caspase-like protein
MGGKRSALLIPTFEYADPKLRRLRAPAEDADKLGAVLRNPDIGDFEVTVMANQPEHKIRRAIAAFFEKRHREDVLLLHFSCHGVKDDDGNLYFAASDTEIDHLDATATSADWVNRQITRTRSRRVLLLLDCCYSGAYSSGMVPHGDGGVQIKERFTGDGRGRIILTASSGMEYSWEGDKLTGEGRPSIFTSALVEGLRSGAADRDEDGRVSVDELYEYVYDRVTEITPDQTPHKFEFEASGKLYIARSKLTEGTLPADLRYAIDSPYAHIRQGAVSVLAALLHGDRLAVAERAHAALNQLAEDDSKSVSFAARAVLNAPTGEENAAGGLVDIEKHDDGTPDAVALQDATIVLNDAGSQDDTIVLNGAGSQDDAVGVDEHAARELEDPLASEVGKTAASEVDDQTAAPEIDVKTALPRPDTERADTSTTEEVDEGTTDKKIEKRRRTDDHRWWTTIGRREAIGGAALIGALIVTVLLVVSPDDDGGGGSGRNLNLADAVAYERADERGDPTDLYAMNADGSAQQALDETPVVEKAPAWSPDHSRLAFIAEGDVFWGDVEEEEPIQVTTTDVPEFAPAWSPDGQRIVFERGYPGDLFIMSVMVSTDGAKRENVTDTVGDENGPAWAPGPMIAYKFAETPKAPGDIYLINPGDSEGDVLVDGPENQWGPAWSPADDKLAFVQDGDIHLVYPSGGDLEQLTSGEEIDGSPTWSPDGTLIAFERAAAPGQQTDIYIVDLNGQVVQLTDTDEWESNPAW